MEITDPGSISLALQVTILFLLIIGLPFVKGKDSKNNAKRHGYSTLAAIVLHTVLIFGVMVPSFGSNLGDSRLFFSGSIHCLVSCRIRVVGGSFSRWFGCILAA